MAKRKTKKDTALAKLIAAAPSKALSELILNLAENDPEIRRECFDYLKENTDVSKMLKRQSEGEAIMSIWAELLPDLEDLDAYGGGPYGVEDQVWELLYEITKRLTSKKVDETYRREILDSVLPFIKSGNSGAGDALDELAYAACYSASELRYPEKILKWYLSGLGNLSSSQKREEYARKAGVMAKVRHMLIDVMNDETRWRKMAVKVKKDNLRRPAFQQEFAHTVQGWEAI